MSCSTSIRPACPRSLLCCSAHGSKFSPFSLMVNRTGIPWMNPSEKETRDKLPKDEVNSNRRVTTSCDQRQSAEEEFSFARVLGATVRDGQKTAVGSHFTILQVWLYPLSPCCSAYGTEEELQSLLAAGCVFAKIRLQELTAAPFCGAFIA